LYNALLETAVEQTGDSCFGLHLGEYLSLSAAGLIGQITQTCNTVHEALEYMVAFANLGCQALPVQLKERKKDWLISYTPSAEWKEQSPVAVRHTLEAVMAFSLREFHTLTLQKTYPRAVYFDYERPARFGEYERIFQCPVHFAKAENAMVLDKEQVAAKVVTSDYRLLRLLVQHAEQKLAGMQSERGFFSVVRQSVLNMVKPQFPSMEQVAANLNMSPRTLQRRLREEGYTFSSLIDELRRQLACDYLRKKELSIKEIAYLLNYSEPSAFVRSFKRWEQVSPGVWRSRQ
ncbi:MAG: AraC family transcriptional regulator ligand-binding domain-containing protein, partial [Bacteroidota bacterium]